MTPQNPPSPGHPKPFLGVYFVNCRIYGRLYKNKDGTAYEGKCPRCGHHYRIPIGSHGTSARMFKAICPPGGAYR